MSSATQSDALITRLVQDAATGKDVQVTAMPKGLPGPAPSALDPKIAALLDEDLPAWVKQAQELYNQNRSEQRLSFSAPHLLERNGSLKQLHIRLLEEGALYKEAMTLRKRLERVLSDSPTDAERSLAEEGLGYINAVKIDKECLLATDFAKPS